MVLLLNHLLTIASPSWDEQSPAAGGSALVVFANGFTMEPPWDHANLCGSKDVMVYLPMVNHRVNHGMMVDPYRSMVYGVPRIYQHSPWIYQHSLWIYHGNTMISQRSGTDHDSVVLSLVITSYNGCLRYVNLAILYHILYLSIAWCMILYNHVIPIACQVINILAKSIAILVTNRVTIEWTIHIPEGNGRNCRCWLPTVGCRHFRGRTNKNDS